jgi:hypothetical protein
MVLRYDNERYDGLEQDAELDLHYPVSEECIVCHQTTDEMGGEWCVNCGGWVCNGDWNRHRKTCLKNV